MSSVGSVLGDGESSCSLARVWPHTLHGSPPSYCIESIDIIPIFDDVGEKS